MANAGSFKKGEKRPGQGRPKGSIDKGNALIRDMICQALHGVGGVEYLQSTAQSHPAAFLALIGKVMPVQVDATIQHRTLDQAILELNASLSASRANP